MFELFFFVMEQQAGISNMRFCFKLGEAATEICKIFETVYASLFFLPTTAQ
jgi:hypothetical protein